MKNKLYAFFINRIWRKTTFVAIVQIVALFLIKDTVQRDLILTTTSGWLAWTRK